MISVELVGQCRLCKRRAFGRLVPHQSSVTFVCDCGHIATVQASTCAAVARAVDQLAKDWRWWCERIAADSNSPAERRRCEEYSRSMVGRVQRYR